MQYGIIPSLGFTEAMLKPVRATPEIPRGENSCRPPVLNNPQ